MSPSGPPFQETVGSSGQQPASVPSPPDVSPAPNSIAPQALNPKQTQPESAPTVFAEALPPIQNAAAVAGGVAGLAAVAGVAGALTFRGASLQKARLAAARAEFLSSGSSGGS
ncbi:hypothetical protein ABH922_000724 [Rhodococcus sp. 27YEA15]